MLSAETSGAFKHCEDTGPAQEAPVKGSGSRPARRVLSAPVGRPSAASHVPSDPRLFQRPDS